MASISNPPWKIDKIIKKGDYLYAKVPSHPRATKNGYVLEHRIVMENHIGRVLEAGEIVHHINGNKHDNSLTNLNLMTAGEHCAHHTRLRGVNYASLRCPNCSKIWDIPARRTFLKKGGKYTCCSRRCNGQLGRQIQLHGWTSHIKMAISKNLIREYIVYP